MVERLRRATLGEFEIGRELGRGGMAAVFLAHEISLDRKVAIKVMSPGLLLGDGMIDRFRHEAITIAHLHHPNIVSVYSVRQVEGLHFFVMRYVQGRSLEQVIQQAGRLPLPVARSILHQVGSALTYAHRSRVIHRDIKPANILIDQDGNAVVTDFGIAKAAERPTQTITGVLVGTPAYMSPEQCSGAEVSGASDQYALGAVAYEMLAGVPPFSGSTLTVMQAHVERPPVPIRERHADCPPDLEAAILRMLEKDPAARWPRMADAMAALGATPLAEDDPLRAELSQLAARAGGTTLSGDPTPTSPAPLTRPSYARGQTSGRAVGGISILPPPAGLEVGDSFVLVAMVRGQHGTRLPPNSVIWSCDASEVLRFDSGGGVAVAIGAGSTLLTATSKEVRALLRVEVAPPRADEIVIGPLDHAVGVGDEIRLDAVARDKRGQPIDRPVTWQSADSATATVTAEGVLVALTPGFSRVTAVLDNARASIAIPVLPARVAAIRISDWPTTVAGGRTFVLTATPVDRWGSQLAGRTVLWSSSDVRVAVVTAGGWVHALRAGTVVLTATCEGVNESVKVTVGGSPSGETAAPVDAAVSEPRPTGHRRLRRRRRTRVVAVALGLGLVGGALWFIDRSRQPTDSAALPTRVDSAESQPAAAGAAPASLVITGRPARALRPTGSTRLAAEVRGSDGQVMPGAGVTWSSSDPAVARVDSATGWVRALRPGRAQVVAAAGDRRDTVAIVVRPPPAEPPAVASISIAPRESLRVGDAATLEAVALDGKGDTLAGADVSWRSSNLSVAFVDPRTGRVEARSPGTALILAESGGESALSQLTVLPPAVAGLAMHGARPLLVGETLALRAEPRDERGEELSGREVGWTSSDSTVLAVDPGSGVVDARAPGSAEITATSEGRSSRVRITVSPAGKGPSDGGDAVILEGVEECYAMIRSRDVPRLIKLYLPETPSDEDNLEKLSRILRTSEWDAEVGERTYGARQIGPRSAQMEFSFRLTWKDAFGGRRSSRPVFRAEFSRSGDRWEMSSCRMLGSPKL